MSKHFYDYYRCPESQGKLALRETPSAARGYFRFNNAVCFGRCSGGSMSSSAESALHDAFADTKTGDGTIYLPFDLTEVMDNLRCEHYVGDWRKGRVQSALAGLYYLIRPALPFGMRSYIKQLYLRGREELQFPRWPVDCSVDNLVEQVLLLSLKASGDKRIPFVWFWPKNAPSCAIMTHDVETEEGVRFCPDLMDIDDSFGIKASFQIVPEERYRVRPDFLALLRERGFEVVVHDLNHDGHLYRERQEFLHRAKRINSYQRQYQAEGFRAAVLYRNQQWFDAFTCSYDMSVPNVARLDPQQGGCCTVMPFFIGDIVELPVTTTQDYMLYYMLNDYSINLWKRQIELIREKCGLMSFIIHPDYIMKDRERAVYEELLAHLVDLRKKNNVWITTPGEVNRWWRQRAGMRVVEDGKRMRVDGVGSERACVAFASEEGGRLTFTLQAKPEGQDTNVGLSPPGMNVTV